MIPHSYGVCNQSFSVFIPIIISILLIAGCVALLLFREKIFKEKSKSGKTLAIYVVTIVICAVISAIISTVPYAKMNPSKNTDYKVLETYDIVSYDYDNWTATINKDGKEETVDCLFSVDYDNNRVEVQRYSWLGMYRDYYVCYIVSPDATKIEETSTDTDATPTDATVTDTNESTTETTEE